MIRLLGQLVTLPVSGPVKGALWVGEQAAEAAERELYDEQRIIAELGELARSYERGEVGDAEHDQREAALLDRLAEARRRHAAQEPPSI